MRGEKRACRVFAHVSPSFAFATNPAGERSDHGPLARFEKDRELEDAIIRKRKSQLVPPQRDIETRARKLCLRWIIWQLKSAAMEEDAYLVQKVTSPLSSRGNITPES